MAEVPPNPLPAPFAAPAADGLPAVHLELRHGSARPTAHDVSDVSFLIGSVPGCDLRLPGANLPPVLCLISREPDGVILRKLSPTQAILLNARPVSSAPLADGDRLTIGPCEILLQIRLANPEPRTPPPPSAELETTRRQLEAEHAARTEGLQQRERELADVLARRQQIEDEQRLLERSQAQHRADLVRLDRREAQLEDRHKQLEQRALEVDRRFEQLQRDSRELEEQAGRLDEWHTKLQADAERLAQESAGRADRSGELAQRAAALEGQQAALATLRTRLERMREEVRREAQLLTEQRTRQEAAEQEIQQRLTEAQKLHEETAAEQLFQEQERRRFEERSAALEAAVAQARQLQENHAAQEARLREQTQQVETCAAEQAEQSAVLEARAVQLAELQQRLDADRQALRERERILAQAEQARETLQAQLLRRAEELAARQRAIADIEKQHASTSAVYQEQLAQVEAARAGLEQERQQRDEELAGRRRELDAVRADLDTRAQNLEASRHKLAEVGRTMAAERKLLAEERARRESEQNTAVLAIQQSRTELASDRQDALDLQRQLPELELRAREALERLTAARDRLREHLAELHTYARQGHDDLETLRAQVQAEAEQVRQERLALHRARDEHRLAVAAFRQHIIDWQGQITEMKRALAHGETRLERRRAQVDEQARQIDATSARLAQQAQELEVQQRQVAERRSEVERHLEDMRQWYRRKLRELAIGKEDVAGAEAPETPPTEAAVEATGPRTILALTGDVAPGDRQLGDLMRSLELVDSDTLNALLVEARRQRRSLRQVLLAGGYLTLYQLALIEAGNVDALVLGPTRVIDRLRATTREAVYRVFDPRRGQECALRHLSEAEAADPARADEFRQRFTAAVAVQHPHVAATLEVLEIAGRPAVLQEYAAGLPSSDWPALAAVPGVWYRLLAQAAVGLHAAHQAGLVHGHLRPESVVLTADGTVKLCGFGEPPWLLEPVAAEEGLPTAIVWGEDAAADLASLGAVALGWAAATRRKGTRTHPLPESLQAILHHLTPEAGPERILTAAALLAALDQAGADVPPNAEAWDRLLHHVRAHAPAETALRKSA